MSEFGLVPGSIKELLSIKDHHKWQGKPIVVQVNNIKVINEQSADKKYRCVFSDGKYTIHSVIGTQCNEHLEANGFTRFSIIAVKAHTLVKTQKRILLAEDVEVRVPKTDKIGTDLTIIDLYYEANPQDDLAANSDLRASSATPVAAPKKPTPKPASRPDKPITPIDNLSPFQNNWTIRGRLSYKGDMRKWNNARGEGKLFNVNFLDESEEIRATAFNEMAEKFFNLLEEGKVYYVTKAKVVPAKPQYSRLSHTYELSLDRDTEITECFDNDDVPTINFNFTKLNKIKDAEPNAIVDVIGILKTVNPVGQITSRSTGKPFDRRNVTIVDDSNYAIDVTLWNNTAVDFDVPEGSVIAFKGVKTNDFGGRSLSLTPGSSMISNPEAPESYQLKGWYDNQGVNESFQTFKQESSGRNNIADRKTIAQAQEENLGTSEKPDYFSIKATINYIRTENLAYPACTNEVQNAGMLLVSTCNRKVVDVGDGWRCEKCNLSYNEPSYRYILSCSVMDASGQIWVTLFDQDAQKVLGRPATEVVALQKDDSSRYEFAEILSAPVMKEYNLRIKARQDTYNGQSRVRYQVAGLSDVDFTAELTHLTAQLDAVL